MAEYVVVDKEQLEADLKTVADSIRAKANVTEKLEFPSEYKSVVESIDTSKPEQEKTISITENGTTSVTPDEGKVLSKVTVNVEVESGGGDTYYDTFWDLFQENGKRTNYHSAFRGTSENGTYGWSNENFKPKYDISITRADSMFERTSMLTDLSEIGIQIDTSKCLYFQQMFAYCSSLTEAVPLDMSSIKDSFQSGLFRACGEVKKIEIYNIPDLLLRNSYANTKNTFQYWFINCFALEEVVITGTIFAPISFAQSSLLTLTSAKTIINCLKNLAGTQEEGVPSIAFHNNTWALLDGEGNASPNGNTWKEYILDLGWTYN